MFIYSNFAFLYSSTKRICHYPFEHYVKLDCFRPLNSSQIQQIYFTFFSEFEFELIKVTFDEMIKYLLVIRFITDLNPENNLPKQNNRNIMHRIQQFS